MSFHRFAQPSYPGFPSLVAPPGGVSFNGTTYDLINVIDSGTGAGGSAFTDGYKTTGPNTGTYLHAFGEDATSSNFNRGMLALAQNCDFIDDLMNRALSVPVRTALVTAVSPVSSIVLPIATFVGDVISYPIDMLFNIVDDQDRAIIASGTRVQVSSITGPTIGDGFSTGSVTLNLSVAIPTSTQYRVFYGTRSKLATLPTDAFTFDRTYGLYADIIPYAGSGNWKDGNPLSATNVEQALDEIVSDLADSTNGSSGARRIGYNGSGSLWAGGSSLAATSVEQAIDEVVATLGLTTNGSTGSSKVGYNGSTSLWKDATALAATNVETAIDEVVTTLASVATGTGSGASKIGVYATSFADALTGVGGGGILNASTQLKAALTDINAALVARRGFTAVVTDGTTSVGGDINTTLPFSAIDTLGGGTFLLRRGAYTLTSPPGDFDYVLIGERGSNTVTLTCDTTSASFTRSSTTGLSNFENIKFIGGAGPFKYFNFNDGTLRLRHCGFTAGSLNFYPVSFGLRLQVESLQIFDSDVLIERDAAMLFSSSANQEVTGTLRGVRISHVPTYNNATQAKYGIHQVTLVPTANPTAVEALTFENSVISISTGFGAGSGAVFRSENSNNPVIFKGCVFRQGMAGSDATVIEIDGSSNITFDDCTVTQSGIGKTLSIVGAGTNNIKFKNTKFYTSNLAALSQEFYVACGEVDAPPVVFENCVIYLRESSDTVEYRIEFNSLNGADVATANGSLTILGLKVVLDYTSGAISPRFFYVNSTPTSYGSVLSFKNLSFYLNANRLKVASEFGVVFSTGQTPCYIENLNFHGVREPLAPATADTCHLVYMKNAHVLNGSLQGDSTGGGLAWKALFQLDTEATLSKFIFHANDNVVRGRCIRMVGNYAIADACRALVTSIHANERATGWFCSLANDISHCEITDNEIEMTTGMGALSSASSALAIINLGTTTSSAFGHHVVRDNSFTANDAVPYILSNASYSRIGNNTYDQVNNVINVPTTIELNNGERNHLFGNILHKRVGANPVITYGTQTGTLPIAANIDQYNTRF